MLKKQFDDFMVTSQRNHDVRHPHARSSRRPWRQARWW
jgi:hypothetical protein